MENVKGMLRVADQVVEDYGNELLVQISSGKEITVYKDEVYFL